MFAHWDACLLYLSARMDDFDEDRTWVGYLGLKSRTNADQYAWALFKACSHMRVYAGMELFTAPVDDGMEEVLLTTCVWSSGRRCLRASSGPC